MTRGRPKGWIMPQWHRDIVSKTHKGKIVSPETRKKLSELQKGLPKKIICVNGHSRNIYPRTVEGKCPPCERMSVWKQHGIKWEDGSELKYSHYESVYTKQNGRCRICNVHQDGLAHSLSVDHDHDNGKFRSLLCSKCNQAIGLFNENPDILVAALNYVRYFKTDKK